MKTTDIEYDGDRRWCPRCEARVAYLSSPEASFCIECGARVRMFRSPRERRQWGIDYPMPGEDPPIPAPKKPPRGNRRGA